MSDEKKSLATDQFLSARKQWNDYVASNIAGLKMWKAMTAVSMLLALVCAFGMVWNSVQSKYIPYVIEVDKLGHVASGGPVQVSTYKNERVIKATLADFIEEARSVTPDSAVQANMINRLYTKMTNTDPAIKSMNEYLNGTPEQNPFNRAKSVMVSVEITSILAQSEYTYYVEWDEHVKDRNGNEKQVLHMKALITIYIVDPVNFSEEMLRINPAGIFIQNFSWQQV